MAVDSAPGAGKPLTLTFISSSTQAETQSGKSLRWVDSAQRVKKERARKTKGRAASDSPTSSNPPDSASSDDATSPSSDDSASEFGVVVVPYRYGVTIHPALNEASNVQTRRLFSHCKFHVLFGVTVLTHLVSEIIAGHMVVLDSFSFSNGYRDVILPLAHQDENLAQAVSVVSAFHLGQRDPRLQRLAEAGHQAIVQKLRRDSLQLSPEQLFNPYILATILVLLVGETITGADNYTYLLEMLNCLTQYPDWISMLPPSLKDFFLQQIKMYVVLPTFV